MTDSGHHLLDVIKVNIAGWGTIGITQSGIMNMAEMVQSVGTACLVLLTVGYTIYKWIVAVKKHEWDKQDRNNN